MREITSGVSPPRASGSPRKAKPRQSGQVCMRNLGWSSPSTAGRYGEHRACQNFSSKARERSLNARILGVEYSDRGSNLMANPLASGPGHTGHIRANTLTLGKRPPWGGTAWILLKAAVSPRTRPFPELAPRRG